MVTPNNIAERVAGRLCRRIAAVIIIIVASWKTEIAGLGMPF
jgi:hypothetical protein